MVTTSGVVGIGLVALGLVLTPGPNMVYLVSRSVAHGRRAGFVSLLGIAVGFAVYLLGATAGLASVFALVPGLYVALKLAGAVYLGYLAWSLIRRRGPGFAHDDRAGEPTSTRRLFTMGLVTNLLNPKIAILYVSLLPQFVEPALGNVPAQSLILGAVQITVALTVNSLIVVLAGSLASFLQTHARVERTQRLVSGSVLGGLALRVAFDRSTALAPT